MRAVKLQGKDGSRNGVTVVTTCLNQGTHCPGKTGKMVPKNPCQGTRREFGNFAKTQGIWFAQVVNSLILKVKEISIIAANFFSIFKSLSIAVTDTIYNRRIEWQSGSMVHSISPSARPYIRQGRTDPSLALAPLSPFYFHHGQLISRAWRRNRLSDSKVAHISLGQLAILFLRRG